MTTKRIVSQLLLCLLSLHQSKTFKMFSFMFCSEFSNMRNIHYTRDTNIYPSLSFSIFSSKLLILHEFKLFLILYAKCKCNITTSKEDKPPYQYNTRCTRGPSSHPHHHPTPCHLAMMNECQLVEASSPHANITNPYFFLRAAFPRI